MFLLSAYRILANRRNRIQRLGLAAIAAIFLLAVPTARSQSTPQPAEKGEAAPGGNAENGKKVFTKDGCYECHGREGQGAAQGAGPRIGPLQLSFEAFSNRFHRARVS